MNLKSIYHKRYELPVGTSTTHCSIDPGMILYHVGLTPEKYPSIEVLEVDRVFGVGKVHYVELTKRPALAMAQHTGMRGQQWYVSRPCMLRAKDRFDSHRSLNVRAIREYWSTGWVFVDHFQAEARLKHCLEELEKEMEERISHFAGCKAHYDKITTGVFYE